MTRIFLTGASGTIGSALVPELLKQPGAELVLLLRAQDDADLHRRVQGLLRDWRLAPGDPHAARLMPVRGDISLPDFGLQPQQAAQIFDSATHIIHCAASVKLNMSLDQARATAVTPTRTVLALARRSAQAGRLKKLEIVSTVGVWGRTPGHMPERRLPEVSEFHNTYEEAKAEAERVIWAEGQDLPITVHRPSMVVGSSVDGRVSSFQVFYHLCEFLSGQRTFGIMPVLGHTRLDTVPVDWVAAAIAWSSTRAETAGSILHLCSGPTAAIDLKVLQQVVRESWLRHGRKTPRLWTVKRELLQRMIPIIGAVAGKRTQRALRGLPPVLAYLAEDQGFQNVATKRLLEQAGLPLPPVESYLGVVLDHYLQAQASSVRH